MQEQRKKVERSEFYFSGGSCQRGSLKITADILTAILSFIPRVPKGGTGEPGAAHLSHPVTG